MCCNCFDNIEIFLFYLYMVDLLSAVCYTRYIHYTGTQSHPSSYLPRITLIPNISLSLSLSLSPTALMATLTLFFLSHSHHGLLSIPTRRTMRWCSSSSLPLISEIWSIVLVMKLFEQQNALLSICPLTLPSNNQLYVFFFFSSAMSTVF